MRKWVSRLSKILLLLFVVLGLLELSYRYYIIDFYRPELEALNTSLEIANDRPTILFMGDSFTGNQDSYFSRLRDELGFSVNLINAAVSGTGIIETQILSGSRIKEFDPDVVVYQIYIGNDLLDIRHRVTGSSSFQRRFYYFVSDRLRVLKFINYRLGQIRRPVYHDIPAQVKPQGKSFSAKNYSSRQKLIFTEEPDVLSNSLLLENGRNKEFERLINGLGEIRNELKPTTKLMVIVLPHCAQVSEVYHARMIDMGMANFKQEGFAFYKGLESAFEDIYFINPLEEFKRLEREGVRLYFQDDPHLSKEGQNELAKLVEPILLKALDE